MIQHSFFMLESTFPAAMHSASFYREAASFTLLLLAIAGVAEDRWACTNVAAIYTIFHLTPENLTNFMHYVGAGKLYVILFCIVFAETGLVVTPVLPGDSLLFAIGVICADANSPLHLGTCAALLLALLPAALVWAAEPSVPDTPAARQFTGYLKAFATLKSPVDAFFDTVMVLAEDAALRRNRLALLADLRREMNRVADISKLAA